MHGSKVEGKQGCRKLGQLRATGVGIPAYNSRLSTVNSRLVLLPLVRGPKPFLQPQLTMLPTGSDN